MVVCSFLKDMNKQLLISQEAIAKKIKEIAAALNCEYAGKELVIVAILKGSICLVADLIRQLEIPAALECIQAKRYGMHGTVPGKLQVFMNEPLDLEGKSVLLIDDIYDSGETLSGVYHELEKLHPKSIETLVLLRKKVTPTGDISPTYVCFDIEDRFVVGYGLDYKEQFRGLKALYII